MLPPVFTIPYFDNKDNTHFLTHRVWIQIDYSAVGLLPPEIYPKQDIYNETEQRGGTLITLNKDSSVTVSQIPFTRNLYQEELDKRKVKR